MPVPSFAPVRLPRRRAALALATAILVWLMLTAGLLTAPAQAAIVPGSFTVSSVTSTSAKLTWTASAGAIGYRVYRGPSSAADSDLTLIATTDASVLTYTSSNLRSSYGYRFQVAALDLDNTEARTASKTVTTSSSADTTAPAAPSSTSFGVSAFSANRVDLSWGVSSSSDVAYYEVLQGTTVIGTVDRVAATKFSVNGLAPSTTYSFSVRSVDSAGNRSGVVTKSVKTLATGTVKIVRGPYTVQVTASSAVIVWWSNITATGTVSMAGGTVGSDSGTGTMHEVTVTGLTAGKQYSYTVSTGGVSATGTVHTAAPPGQPFTFAVIGDYGAGSAAESKNAAQIATYNSDFLQTVGDNIYPSSGFPDPNPATTYSDIDGRVFKQMGSVLKTQAFLPANGNHEYYSNGQWWNAFPMLGSNHSWYSYNWGDAHILVLDSMQPFDSGSPQYSFVQSDLGSAAARNAKWRIVALPNPPYNTTTAASGGSSQARASLVPLFDQFNVDLVLSGDAHNYQRTKPITGSTPTPTAGGVTYVVTGGGGNGLNAISGTMPSWQAYREGTIYESVKVQVSATALTVSAISASDGSVIDTTTLGTSTSADTTSPSTPTGLKATPADTSVALSWTASTDNVGVDHYNVFRNGAQISGAAPTGTSYTDTGLAAGTPYSYTVQAVDAAGNVSAQSSAFSTTTTTSTGGGGTSGTLVLTPTNDSTIDPATSTPTTSRLKMDASSPVNDALLQFSVPSTCPVTAASLKLTVGSGSTDPSNRGGDIYATDNGNWSESSVVWNTAPAKDTTKPPVSLTTAVALNTAYTWNVTSLVPSTGGTFTLRGSNTSSDGAGYYSKEGSATLGPRLTVTCGTASPPPSGDTTAPSTPAGLSATATSSTTVSLSWTASTDNVGVAHYNVFRNGAPLSGAAPTGPSFTDSTVQPSTTYSYTVQAVDAAGNVSGQSNVASATTPAGSGGGGTSGTLVLTPTNDSTIDPATSTPTSSRLKMDASSPVNDALLQFSVPSTCSVTAASLKLTVGSGSTDPSVRGGDIYATNNGNWSESSVVWNTAPAKDTTKPPVSLTTAVALNTAYTWNVTSLVPSTGGTFTLRGSNTSSDGAGYYSKEGSSSAGPRLTVTCG